MQRNALHYAREHTHIASSYILLHRLASSETTYSVFVISGSPTLSTSLQIPRHKVLPFRRPSTQDSTPYLCPCIMLHHVCTCYTTRNTTQCIGVYLIHGILYICIHTMRSIVLHHLAWVHVMQRVASCSRTCCRRWWTCIMTIEDVVIGIPGSQDDEDDTTYISSRCTRCNALHNVVHYIACM